MILEAIQSYLSFIENQKRYSRHTVLSYKNDLEQFEAYFNAYYGQVALRDLTHIHLRSWMVDLKEKGLTNRSVNRKISTLRSFFNFQKKNGHISKNPTLKIATPKLAKRLPTFVREKNIEKLFDTIPTHDFRDLQSRVIIELMYCTGIRKSELIQLKDNSIDKANKSLKVVGKGNKERLLPLSDALIDKLEHLIQERQTHFAEAETEDGMFLTMKGKNLYPKYLYNLVKSYLSTVTSLEKRSPHILRHSFATHLMNGGADLNAVKKLLGHASLAATQVYTHNSIEKLKEVYLKSHPKSR